MMRAVVEPEEELRRPVAGVAAVGDLEGADAEAGGKLLAQIFGQAGESSEIRHAFMVEPVEDLGRPERLLPHRFELGSKLVEPQVADVCFFLRRFHLAPLIIHPQG